MTLRVAGAIEVKTDGGLMEAKGQWSYNLGHPKREPERQAGSGRFRKAQRRAEQNRAGQNHSRGFQKGDAVAGKI